MFGLWRTSSIMPKDFVAYDKMMALPSKAELADLMADALLKASEKDKAADVFMCNVQEDIGSWFAWAKRVKALGQEAVR